MAEITLYSHKRSRGRAVHWLLEELEVPYHVEWLEFGATLKSEAYLAINPMGKLPALTHGEAVVTETAAILTYLADHYADKGLIPPLASPARAAFFRWLFFVAGPLEAATTAALLDWQTPQTTRLGTPAKGFLGFGTLDLTLDTLAAHLHQQLFLCGEQFTAADIYLSSHLQMDMFYTKTVAPRPVFTNYLRATLQRPAKQRADAA